MSGNSRPPSPPSRALGGCLIVTGGLISGFFLLAIIGASMDPKTTVGMFLGVLGFIAGGVGMIVGGVAQLKKRKRMLAYVDIVIMQDHWEVEKIAKLVDMKKTNVVMDELQATINAGMLPGFRLDPESRTLVSLNHPSAPPKPKIVSFVCASCGAHNQIETVDGRIACDYCGQPFIQ